jgi:hypothetical protein
MTLLVRDEEDVIDANLRHHLNEGIDFFVVTDNRSRDGTRAVLERYAQAGLAEVIDQPGDDFDQGVWVTAMARAAASGNRADWVINADADEFFCARTGSVRDALAEVPDEFGKIVVPRLNHRPRPAGAAPFHERMVVREAVARNLLGEPLPPKMVHRAGPEVVVGVGNHDVSGIDTQTLPAQPLEIHHFPVRSYAQLARKIELGGAAVERNPRFGPELGYVWRKLRELQREDGLRSLYDDYEIDDARLEDGLRLGELVIDTRIAERLASPGGERDR